MSKTPLRSLESVAGHPFRNRRLLEKAVTHSTHRQRDRDAALEDNERLEFLGDAVLGLVVSQFLTDAFPAWTAGQLSLARARLVSAESLSEAARRIHLGSFLRLGRGEEKTGGRAKPTLLADAYEALVAAIYCDGGLGPARAFVERTLLPEAKGCSPDELGVQDHKSALQELLQARGSPAAEYRVVGESGPDHSKLFCVEVLVEGKVLGTAEGASKKKAEQQAAAFALQHLRGEALP